MLAILFITLAASPEPSLPTPRFADLPTPNFVAANCACTDCRCVACDGQCGTATEWVVTLDGRTFTVGKSVDRKTAVRLAKEVAGAKSTAASVPSIQSYMQPTTFNADCPNGKCPNVAPATRTRR